MYSGFCSIDGCCEGKRTNAHRPDNDWGTTELQASSMKLARSSNSSTPSPQETAGGVASMSPTAGTSVRWSHRNSAFCPVRSAAAAADTPAAEMPFPAIAAAGQLHVPYGFINEPMSPYLWPLMLPYSPLAAAAGCVAVAGGGGLSLGGLQQLQHLQQQQRLHQLQFSPDRASLDAAGQTPEKAKFTGELLAVFWLSLKFQTVSLTPRLWQTQVVFNLSCSSRRHASEFFSSRPCITCYLKTFRR